MHCTTKRSWGKKEQLASTETGNVWKKYGIKSFPEMGICMCAFLMHTNCKIVAHTGTNKTYYYDFSHKGK